MKVLLIDPGKKFLEKEYTGLIKPYPNIGLIYIGTYLRSKGIAVDFLDVEIEKLTDLEFESYLLEKKPDVVGITTLTYMIQDAYYFAEAVKKAGKNIKVVFGGAHASALPDEVLANENVDVVALAEGEFVLENIVKLLERGEFNTDNLKNIDGIAFRDANQNIIKTKMTFIEDLDQLPFPDWSLAPYHKYAKINSQKYGENIPLYQISASRGCPFRCAFCFPLHGRKVRGRSSQNIFMEMKHLREHYGARHLDFTDSAATYDMDRFLGLCQMLINSGLNQEMNWSIETRVDLVNRELLTKIKEAGGIFVYYGIESGDDNILKYMNKGITVQKVKEAVKLAYDLGLFIKASFIIGHAFETLDSALRTLELALELRQRYGIDLYINLIDVYPGTEFYNFVNRNYGGLKWAENSRNNWSGLARNKACVEVNDLTQAKMEDLLREYNYKLSQIKPEKLYNF